MYASPLLKLAMAAPYNPNQQAYPSQGQVAYLPQTAYGGYPPHEPAASAQYRPLPVVGYNLQQGYSPQPQSNPAQGPPPAYDYKVDQPAYNYPVQVTNASVVVAAQPTAATATTARLSPPEKDYSGIAICALLFSMCTVIVCGMSLICLSLSIPALILSIEAMGTRGSSQRNNAGISIVLNVIAVICTVVLLVAVVTPVAVTLSPRTCSAYYSSSYSTYCLPHSYRTRGSCTYYTSYDGSSGYCPSSAPTRFCPSYYSYTYSTYCTSSVYSTRGSCYYYSDSGGYCPSSSSTSFLACPSYYSDAYSTSCTTSSYYTQDICYYYGTRLRYCPT